MVIYAIQATVKQFHKPKFVAYLKSSLNIDPNRSMSAKLEFPQEASQATFFGDFTVATDTFMQFVAACAKDTLGKTMFEPPLSILLGGEHGRRTAVIKVELVQISGLSLARSAVAVISTVSLKCEEYEDGRPFTVKHFEPFNVELREGKAGGVYLQPPTMQEGDEYLDTYFEEGGTQVKHEARDPLGRVVIYTCTKQGNLLYRQQQE